MINSSLNSSLEVFGIETLPKNLFDNLLENRLGRHRSPITKQARQLLPGQGFFIVSEKPRAFSEVYNVGKNIKIRRAEKDGKLGYWVLCIS